MTRPGPPPPIRPRRGRRPAALARPEPATPPRQQAATPERLGSPAMSKRTNKARTRAKRNKANHGRKPNRGRG
jgi:hypothetical protein